MFKKILGRIGKFSLSIFGGAVAGAATAVQANPALLTHPAGLIVPAIVGAGVTVTAHAVPSPLQK